MKTLPVAPFNPAILSNYVGVYEIAPGRRLSPRTVASCSRSVVLIIPSN